MNQPLYMEAELIHALRHHQSADFARLYAAYSSALYGVIFRLVKDPIRAEDLLQDAFIKIWLNSQDYDPDQGRLFTWLLAITRNVALSDLRAQKVRLKASTYLGEWAEPATLPDLLEGTLTGSLVSSLEPTYRTVVELMYFQGFTGQEAAKKLKLPLGTVKTRVRSALQQLRVQFSVDIEHYRTGNCF